MVLAAASGPPTVQNVKSRAPMMSPPSGSRALTASRTNLRRTTARSRKRPLAGNSNHQPAPATETVAARVSTTNGIPQPTHATALPTASMPDHALRPMQAAIPVHQATTPTYLSAPMRTLVLNATIGQSVMQRTGISIASVVEGNRKTDSRYAEKFPPNAQVVDSLRLPEHPHQHQPDSGLRVSHFGWGRTMRIGPKTGRFRNLASG